MQLLEASTDVSCSELDKCQIWGIQRARYNSSADVGQKFLHRQRVRKNIFLLEKPPTFCHFLGHFAAHVPVDTLELLHRSFG